MNFLYFILVCITVLIIYLTVIFVIQYYKHVDTDTAKKVLLKYLKKCLSSTPAEPYWGITIGYDAQNNIHADVINNVFKELNQIYRNYYFYDVRHTYHNSIYVFKVTECIADMSDSDRNTYCQNICNSIIHKYIQQYYPNFTHIEHLVFTYINNVDLLLYICIAQNNTGLKLNAHYSNRLYLYFKAKETPVNHSSDIIRKWD